MTVVNILSRGDSSQLLAQRPTADHACDGVTFISDPEADAYDWLVVRDNPPKSLLRRAAPPCPQSQTIFVATEPACISRYGASFVKQFQYLITNQSAVDLPHPRAFRTQPGSRWFYGKTMQEILGAAPAQKTRALSLIATNKRQRHTLHEMRFSFQNRVLEEIPQADVLYSAKALSATFENIYGSRLQYAAHKHQMIDPYRYHLAIGNVLGENVLTERVIDALLGHAVPIAFGCANMADFFPEGSYIDIDIRQPDEAIDRIQSVLSAPNDYADRFDALCAARELALYKYNLIMMISEIVKAAPLTTARDVRPGRLVSRRAARMRSPRDLWDFAQFKAHVLWSMLARRDPSPHPTASEESPMFAYALRRLISAIPVLLIAVTACFFVLRLAPGGPFDMERPLPPRIVDNLRAYYHMDEHLILQYLRYVGGVLQGDLGPSFVSEDFTVAERIAGGLPYSLILGGSALVVALVLGVISGVIGAVRQNTLWDYGVGAIVMLGLVVPNFVIAPILQLVFGIYFDWLPVGGWGDGSIDRLILPVMVLASSHIARISRLTRGSLIETLKTDYVRTARAKGLGPWRTVTRHALKPALAPVVSYLGPAAGFLLTGSIVVESIFGLPGVGRYFIESALNRDYGMVLGTVIFYMTLIIVLNLIVDLAYAWLDPRVRAR